MYLILLHFSLITIAGKPSVSQWLTVLLLALLLTGTAAWSAAIRHAKSSSRKSAEIPANGEELSTVPDILPLIARKSTAIKLAGRPLAWILVFVAGVTLDHVYTHVVYAQKLAVWQAMTADYQKSLEMWQEQPKPDPENTR